jgi:hypothetical protein
MNDRSSGPTKTVGADAEMAVSRVIIEFDEIAMKRYQCDLEALALESSRRRAAQRMRQLVGVAIKKDYSREAPKTTRSGLPVDYQWVVDDELLGKMPDSSWQLTVLKMLPRTEEETGRDVAARLRRETLLQRAYFKAIHPWLCQSPETREQIKEVLKECGLGEFTDLASPKGLLKMGAVKLYAVLAVAFQGTLPAAAIAVSAVSLCVIGLNSICRSASAESPSDDSAQ